MKKKKIWVVLGSGIRVETVGKNTYREFSEEMSHQKAHVDDRKENNCMHA